MRKTAALTLTALILTACGSTTPGTSATPTDSGTSTSSSTPTSSSTQSTGAKKLPAAITASQGVAVQASATQVDCDTGATAVVGASETMQAPDLDELFMVAMIGCEVNGTTGPEVPEVFHWRDNAWVSVATIRVNTYTVVAKGDFKKINENKIHLSVTATNNKGASKSATLEVRRDGLSYWAEVIN